MPLSSLLARQLPSLLAGLTLAAVTVSACSAQEAPGAPPTSNPGSAPQAPGLPLTGDLSPVHDPTIIIENGTAHVFSTSQIGQEPGLIHWRTSTDLRNWTRNGAVFAEMPAWAREQVPGTKGIWAPDVSYVNGEFRLYYCVSRFGENSSAIGLVVTKTLVESDPRFGWVDKGLVFRSDVSDRFNAIDPDLFVDKGGRHWLSFGSFWTGIKLIEIDPTTGKPQNADPKIYDLAQRSSPGAIEAPKMIERNGWFYLFASVEFCCRGVDSTYYTVVGRAPSPTGPFKDTNGASMSEGGGQTFLHSNLDPTGRWVGPGHMTILSADDGDFVAYHAYDRQAGGRPTLRIQRIGWGNDGWPVAQ